MYREVTTVGTTRKVAYFPDEGASLPLLSWMDRWSRLQWDDILARITTSHHPFDEDNRYMAGRSIKGSGIGGLLNPGHRESLVLPKMMAAESGDSRFVTGTRIACADARSYYPSIGNASFTHARENGFVTQRTPLGAVVQVPRDKRHRDDDDTRYEPGAILDRGRREFRSNMYAPAWRNE